MTAPAPQPPAPVPPAAPQQQPHAGFFDRLVHHAEAGAPVIAAELKPVLQGHASGVFALAARVFAEPDLKALAPDMLDLVISAAKIAGVAL